MDLTRIINPRQWDPTRRRFTNVAFKSSTGAVAGTPDSKAGISVFDTACACRDLNGDCLCQHIARYYGHVYPEPCVYWTFSSEILDPPNPNPEGVRAPIVLQVPSDTGDRCHRNVHCVSDNRAKNLFYQHAAPPEEKLRICRAGQSEPFTLAGIDAIKEQLDAAQA